MSDGGKGSQQRPTDPQKFGEGYDRIFAPKEKKEEKPSLAELALAYPEIYGEYA